MSGEFWAIWVVLTAVNLALFVAQVLTIRNNRNLLDEVDDHLALSGRALAEAKRLHQHCPHDGIALRTPGGDS